MPAAPASDERRRLQPTAPRRRQTSHERRQHGAGGSEALVHFEGEQPRQPLRSTSSEQAWTARTANIHRESTRQPGPSCRCRDARPQMVRMPRDHAHEQSPARHVRRHIAHRLSAAARAPASVACRSPGADHVHARRRPNPLRALRRVSSSWRSGWFQPALVYRRAPARRRNRSRGPNPRHAPMETRRDRRCGTCGHAPFERRGYRADRSMGRRRCAGGCGRRSSPTRRSPKAAARQRCRGLDDRAVCHRGGGPIG